MSVEPAGRPRAPVVGLLIAMVIVAVVEAAAALRGTADIFYIAGNTLALGSIAWAVLWFGFVKRTGHRVAGRYWLLIFVSGLVGGGIALGLQKTQFRTASSNIASVYNAAKTGNRSVPSSPQAKGMAGEYERFMRSYMNTLINDQRDYEKELAGIGLETLLSGEELKSDTKLVAAKYKAKRAGEIVAKYRNLYFKRVESAPQMFEKLSLDPSLKESAKVAFAKGAETNRAAITQIWDLEEGIVANYASTVALLAKAQGAWSVAGEQIVFERQSDLDAFNAHLAQIDEFAKKEAVLRAQLDATAQANLARMVEMTE